jgi:hypothetical protein
MAYEAFSKKVYPCKFDGEVRRVRVEIEFDVKGSLCIVGYAGQTCGQMRESLLEGTPCDGWNYEMLQKLVEIWKRWHMNDMVPYCEHQFKLGWRELARKQVEVERYGKVVTETLNWLKQSEHEEGLLMRACPVCGYKHGSAWKKEEVPEEVLDWLKGLPEE